MALLRCAMYVPVFAALALLITGCGDTGGTTSIPGTLDYEDGTPVKAASLELQPSSGAGVPAMVQVRDGKFTVVFGGENGMSAGSYKVMVKGPMLKPEELKQPPTDQKTGGAGPPKMTWTEPAPVPDEYTDKARTPLTVELAAGTKTIALKVKKP